MTWRLTETEGQDRVQKETRKLGASSLDEVQRLPVGDRASCPQMVPDKETTTREKVSVGLHFIPWTEINSKCIINQNVRVKMIKLLGKTLREKK